MKYAIEQIMREFETKLSNVSREDVDLKYDTIIKTYNDQLKEAYDSIVKVAEGSDDDENKEAERNPFDMIKEYKIDLLEEEKRTNLIQKKGYGYRTT